ncbi:uncharacterized protein LOC142768467 [Rhipicephalus microplus]|uniref:uncharacterized protein LOC142768467 n=1 Tax=Rhipicephalus microplus TaxID=6941 RepID=UPI003F6CE6BE
MNVISQLTLKSLRLSYVSDVSVSAIAKHCRGLECLGLDECVVLDEEMDEETLFESLRVLRVGKTMSQQTFFGLLRSCPNLVELKIYDDALTTAFLLGLPEFAAEHRRSSPLRLPALRLKCLEALTLRTDSRGRGGLAGRPKLPEELDRTLACLPELRKVCTDDFRVRFHIERCAPKVRLEWEGCTVCLAEYPKVDEFQEELWLDVHRHVK